MASEFYRNSNLTGKEYNYFNTVKVMNINQAAAYIENDVFPVDVRVGRDDGKRVMMFYFDKTESKDVFDKWCNYELK